MSYHLYTVNSVREGAHGKLHAIIIVCQLWYYRGPIVPTSVHMLERTNYCYAK